MKTIESILDKALNSQEFLNIDDAEVLFGAEDNQSLDMIKNAADSLRSRIVGDKVSYIKNLNVNFTNICDSVCLFCGFRRSEKDQGTYIIDLDELEERIYNAKKDDISEICLQGGLYSKLKIKGLKSKSFDDMYAELLSWVKNITPDVHLHAYSPEEVSFVSQMSNKPINYVLEKFKDHGLGSMPGTAAEILVDEVRNRICPKKINTSEWVDIISSAHRLGIPSTATIMYGHIESNRNRAQHLDVLRQLQMNTSGFSEFVPLAFVSSKTLLNDKIKPLKSIDRLKMLAISRLYFKDLLPNIQASWVKQGVEETAESLDWGVNDIGGTLGNEQITYCAGGNFGRSMSAQDLVDIIKSKSKEPVLRDTLYNNLEKQLVY